MMFFMGDTRMKVTHCCADCGQVMAAHEHSSWQEIKDCDRNRRALCDACRSWPGFSLPTDGTRGQQVKQEVKNNGN
jgi:hypothetical protein